MDELQFWQQKIIQFFHDPPGKPLVGFRGAGKHTELAKALFQVFQKYNRERLRYYIRPPDWAASGADRPMLTTPRKKGVTPLRVDWHREGQSLVTHPLARDFRLRLPVPPPTEAEARKAEEIELGEEDLEKDQRPFQSLRAEQEQILGELAESVTDWSDPRWLEKGFALLWRRFRDALVERRSGRTTLAGDPLWEEMPADTRCPDHSIWDHLKVTTALAFMKPHWMFRPEEWPANRWDDGAREPWLLRVSLGPAQAFIAEARTSRDLWIGSFLLADLAWHALQPIVERYGPDCIVYPDLRGNPRADCWLFRHFREALAPNANPGTFAAVLPNAFVALVPRGGEGHLRPIRDLAEEARAGVNARWRELAEIVEKWFIETVDQNPDRPGQHWRGTWRRQHAEAPVYCAWTAVPWLPMGHIDDHRSLRGRALPVQREPAPQEREAAQRDKPVIAGRRNRLAPWIPKEAWAHYEWARDVYAATNLAFHQMERGFDYALTHHQLSARHALRKATSPGAYVAEEPGEKCTQCGWREALREDGEPGHLENVRHLARRFWSHEKLDPDQTGTERLCGVCALKRFLVEADQDPEEIREDAFNRLWAGMASDFDAVADPGGRNGVRELRVPFPSTATVAAQGYLEAVAQAALEGDPAIRPHVEAVMAACRKAELPRTSFPRALPRLAVQHREARARKQQAVRDFLEYEAEDLLFPETAEGKAHALKGRESEAGDAGKLLELKEAVTALRRATRDRWAGDRLRPPSPGKRIAVIRLDGDCMGRLLLGDAEAIGARWRDVLHPQVLDALSKNVHLQEAGWTDLVEAKRLMGPSLHAFVSRALAGFAHHVVPWVVEREFSGRLIYSGGDDVLCIAPADEALHLAARLQQLFSAAWLVDTDAPADEDPWAWRRRDWQGRYDQADARERFAIPLCPGTADGGIVPVELPVDDPDRLEPHVAQEAGWTPRCPVQGPLLPMLGRHASLSAGIAVGHYKTPLAVLLDRSAELLEWAKAPFGDGEPAQVPGWGGRRALAVGHASRGGEKTRFVLPWGDAGGPPTAHRTLFCVIDAFRRGTLPSRLPYKLRALGPSVRAALERIEPEAVSGEEGDTRRKRLLEGLLATCLDQPRTGAAVEALEVWKGGIFLNRSEPERYADGLLLCRALAGAEGEGEDA